MTMPLKRTCQSIGVLIVILIVYKYFKVGLDLSQHSDNTQKLKRSEVTTNTNENITATLSISNNNNNNNNLLDNTKIQRKDDSIMNRFLNQCWACSNKLKDYVAFHKSVTSRKDFPSYLYENNTENHQVIIYRSPRKNYTQHGIGGIADRFGAMITLFSVCVATNTICLVDWPELEWALERSEFFDSVLFVKTPTILRNFNEARDYMKRSSSFPNNYFLSPFVAGSTTLDPMLKYLKDPLLGKAFGNVYVTHGNWGGIYHLIYVKKDETYVSQLLTHGKIKPEHVYGCMFNLFFTLKTDAVGSNIKALFKETMEAETKNLTKVSLQIRTGDKALREQELRAFRTEEVKDFPLQFFECALALEEINQLPKNSKWILMSDSHQLVLWAKEKYQSRLIYNLNKAGHSGEDEDRQGFIDAVGEFWVSGYGNYFIITEQSGLGRQAAFRSLNVDKNVYVFDRYRVEKREGFHWCLQNLKSWQALAQEWSHI